MEDTSPIIDSMLSGCRAAGAQTRHFVLSADHDALLEGLPGDVECVSGTDGITALVETIERADHAIMGLAAPADLEGPVFKAFKEAGYAKARWMTLADVAGERAFDVRKMPAERPEDFRFPVPAQELTGEHRGLVVLKPPSDIPDHDDPFSENTFFVVEELLRILGFLPSGRILATGFYYPPLEDNPFLQEQSFELGQRLLAGSAALRDRER